MKFYWLLLGVLGVWRVTYLLYAEDGPGGIFVKLRKAVGEGVIGQAMDCFYCLSLWVSAPAALLIAQDWGERAGLWLALSAGAILIERLIPAHSEVQQVHYYEDQPDSESEELIN